MDPNLAFFSALQLELLIVALSPQPWAGLGDPGVLQDSLNSLWVQEETFPIFLNSDIQAEAGLFTAADEKLL